MYYKTFPFESSHFAIHVVGLQFPALYSTQHVSVKVWKLKTM